MSKQKARAKNMVNKALSTFTKAIQEVEKANELLSKEAEATSDRFMQADTKIKELKQVQKETQKTRLAIESEIIGNRELIGKLEQFVK